MGIIEAIEEELRKQAIEEGLAEGRRKGLQEGLREGRQKGLEEGLEKGLEEGLEKGIFKKATIMVYNMLAKTDLPLEQIAGLAQTKLGFITFIKEEGTNWTHPDTWTEDEWKSNLGDWYLRT